MIELKVKFFRANSDSHETMLTSLEQSLELWQSENPEVRIKRTYLTSLPENSRVYGSLVLTVEYVEIIKRGLIVETDGEQ
jgi:hypothetical protein